MFNQSFTKGKTLKEEFENKFAQGEKIENTNRK